jgi:hypothetical protein
MIPLLALFTLTSGSLKEARPARVVQSAAVAPNSVIEAKIFVVDASLAAPRSAALRSVDPGYLAAEALTRAGALQANPTLIVKPGIPAEFFTGDEIIYVKSLEMTDQGVNLKTEKARSGYQMHARQASFRDGTVGIYIELDLSTIEGFTETPDPAVVVPQIASIHREVFLRPDRRESAVIDLGTLTSDNVLAQILHLTIDPERPQRLLIQLTARLAGRR